jgi:hypothetical protein
MKTMEVYVRGSAHIPARFWDYALRTNKIVNKDKFYTDEGFHFSKNDTELYKSLSKEERRKIQFLYISEVKRQI